MQDDSEPTPRDIAPPAEVTNGKRSKKQRKPSRSPSKSASHSKSRSPPARRPATSVKKTRTHASEEEEDEDETLTTTKAAAASSRSKGATVPTSSVDTAGTAPKPKPNVATNEEEPEWDCTHPACLNKGNPGWSQTCTKCRIVNPRHDDGESLRADMARRTEAPSTKKASETEVTPSPQKASSGRDHERRSSRRKSRSYSRSGQRTTTTTSSADKKMDTSDDDQGGTTQKAGSSSHTDLSKTESSSPPKHDIPVGPKPIYLEDFHTVEHESHVTWKHLVEDLPNLRINIWQSDFGNITDYKNKLRLVLISPALIKRGLQSLSFPAFPFKTPYAAVGTATEMWPYGAMYRPNPELSKCRSKDEAREVISKPGFRILVPGSDLTVDPETKKFRQYEDKPKYGKYRMAIMEKIKPLLINNNGDYIDVKRHTKDFSEFFDLVDFVTDLALKASAALSCLWLEKGSEIHQWHEEQGIAKLNAINNKYGVPCLLDEWFHDLYDDVLFNPYKEQRRKKAQSKEGKSRLRNAAQFDKYDENKSSRRSTFQHSSGSSLKERIMFALGQFCMDQRLMKFPKYKELQKAQDEFNKQKDNKSEEYAASLKPFTKLFREWSTWTAGWWRNEGIWSQVHWESTDDERGMKLRGKLCKDESSLTKRDEEPEFIKSVQMLHEWFTQEKCRLNEMPLYLTTVRDQDMNPQLVKWHERNVHPGDLVCSYVTFSFKCWEVQGKKFHARTFLEFQPDAPVWLGAKADDKRYAKKSLVTRADAKLLKDTYGQDTVNSLPQLMPTSEEALFRKTVTQHAILCQVSEENKAKYFGDVLPLEKVIPQGRRLPAPEK